MRVVDGSRLVLGTPRPDWVPLTDPPKARRTWQPPLTSRYTVSIPPSITHEVAHLTPLEQVGTEALLYSTSPSALDALVQLVAIALSLLGSVVVMASAPNPKRTISAVCQ